MSDEEEQGLGFCELRESIRRHIGKILTNSRRAYAVAIPTLMSNTSFPSSSMRSSESWEYR